MSNLISGDFPTKTYRNLNLGVTGQVIKAYKGQIFNAVLCNNASAARFVKLYDKATAPDQTNTPLITVELPASSTITIAVGQGIEFVSGISARATTGVADNDTGAPTANDVVVNIFYL